MPNKPKYAHSDRDRIWTPEALAQQLIRKIPSDTGDSWCDPCYGTGEFFNYFPEGENEWYEIDMGRDYFEHTEKFDWVVTNIPFSQPKAFIEKMSEDCIKGFGILCLDNSMTVTRLKQLENKGLFVHSVTPVYVKEWGFGYRTDFYVFTRHSNNLFESIIVEKETQ